MRRKLFHDHSCNGSFLNGLKVNPVFTTDDEKLGITRSHLSRWKKWRETGSRLHFMVLQVCSPHGKFVWGSNDATPKRRNSAVLEKNGMPRKTLLKRWCNSVTHSSFQRTVKEVVNYLLYYVPGTHPFIEEVVEEVVVEKPSRHVEDMTIYGQ